MKIRSCLALLTFLVMAVGACVAYAAPPAPALLAPATGANLTVPATISWSAVADPTGATIVAYNWQLSPSSAMTPVILMNSTSAGVTQDTVSGLVSGTYFWQVQAVNSAGQQGPWSATGSFVVSGVGPGTPGTPLLGPTQGYSTFHPWESITFNWSAAAGAVTYRLEVSNDPNFPLGPVAPGTQTLSFDNISATTYTYVHTAEGNWFARVFATDSNFSGGIRSLPSNVIQFSDFYTNPIGPAPVIVSPVGNPTLTLPVTLSWANVPNPQASGYVLEVAKDSTFTNIEFFYNQYTDPSAVMLSLTSGPKFWRVLSQQGLASPTTNANTAWSATGTFTVSSATPVPVSIAPEGNPQSTKYSGATGMVAVQLTAGVPSTGATINMSSSNPSVVAVPATIAMPGNQAWGQFPITVGQVSVPTLVTLTASLNGVSASNQLSVLPPTLDAQPFQANPTLATGGAAMTGWVDLAGGGLAGPSGAVVSLSTSSPAAVVPASVTIPAGVSGTTFPITTSPVTASTIVTISANYNGVTAQWPITLTPGPAPTSLLIRPMSTTNGSQAVVTSAEGVGFDQIMQMTSSNPALASVPSTITVAAVSGIGSVSIVTAPVTQPTVVTISVNGGGVTLSAPLTLYPSLPLLTALTVNPTSVVGGTAATGTVTLAGPAPAAGVAVNLGSVLPLAASVPASVIVPGGATSASFPVTTFPHDTTTVQLNAALDNVFQFSAIGVNPPPVGPAVSAVSLNPASVTGGKSSTGTVTLSAPAPAAGAVVTLSSNSAAASVPSSVTVAAGASSANFSISTSSVTASTLVSIAGAYGGVTQAATLTVNPPAPAAPTLVSPAGGATPLQPVAFDWSDVAGAVSYEIQIDDTSTIAAPFIADQFVTVSQTAIGGLPAKRLWWRVRAQNSAGVFGPFSATRSFTPQATAAAPALSALSVSPSSVVGPTSATGTATLSAAAPSGGAVVTLASSNAAVAALPTSVTVPAGATSASFTVTTVAVSASTSVILSGAYGGASRTSTLAVTPVPPPASLSALTLNPASVTGGGTSQGTVTLTSAAPTGGAVVSLASNSATATVPASVTVPAGASSATFTVTTVSVTASTAVSISGSFGGTSQSATLTLNPPSVNALLTVSATGRSGENVLSSPAGINVAVGSTASASFATNSSITLSATNGRTVIWSGACSSGSKDTASCTFTLTGNASVSAEVK